VEAAIRWLQQQQLALRFSFVLHGVMLHSAAQLYHLLRTSEVHKLTDLDSMGPEESDQIAQ
jgi:hypothetical protein